LLFLLENLKTGILLQGRVSKWTIPIIKEFQINFPNSEIVLSTWNNENIEGIPCKIIQNSLPEPTSPYLSTKNFQILGCQNGLKAMNADIILKGRSDQFIHNPKIFEIFLKENSLDKIMYPHLGVRKGIKDYWIEDFCQISSKKTLFDFWNLMPFDDGKHEVAVEIYLTKNYVLKTRKDSRPWNLIKHDYFIPKSYQDVFKIEWEKIVNIEHYRKTLYKESLENYVKSS